MNIRNLTHFFDFFKIPNLTIRLKPDQLSEITLPAIAHCQTKQESYFVLLQSLTNNQICYYREGKGDVMEEVEVFVEKWGGTVLLLAPDENSGEPNYEENRKKEQREKLEKGLMWGALGIFVLVGVFLQTPLYLSGIFLLYGIGTVVSILLLQSEYGQRVEWVEKLCSPLPPNGGINKVNCNTVTQSAGGKIFGFSWAEIGLVYFGGGTISFIIEQLTLTQVSLLSLLHFITLPYVIYSIYYQAFVVRVWCMLCLIVQGVLIMIAVAWLGHYDWHLRDVSGINVVASLLTTASFALMVW